MKSLLLLAAYTGLAASAAVPPLWNPTSSHTEPSGVQPRAVRPSVIRPQNADVPMTPLESRARLLTLVTGTERIMQLWKADLRKTLRGSSHKPLIPVKEVTAMLEEMLTGLKEKYYGTGEAFKHPIGIEIPPAMTGPGGGSVSSDALGRRATPVSAGDLSPRKNATGLPPWIPNHVDPKVFGVLKIWAKIFQAMTALIRKFVRGHGGAATDISERLAAALNETIANATVDTDSELGMTQNQLVELFLPMMQEYAASALRQRYVGEQLAGEEAPHTKQSPEASFMLLTEEQQEHQPRDIGSWPGWWSGNCKIHRTLKPDLHGRCVDTNEPNVCNRGTLKKADCQGGPSIMCCA
ncbi:hypothetical protein LTS18_014346 [Coniosporium uncinatum]|uniref:Uncharacterized protein n=1 Tax=Coniosporium uncinatum TaxID=93489 RepID=A0ACC3D8W5_9PEZI|nr:hypothetical protein LTS18_014346 [Coniosporium uncinatum]